jgi:hypothetical protein
MWIWREQDTETHEEMTESYEPPNKITRAKAGGPCRLAIRSRWAARFAQFCR